MKSYVNILPPENCSRFRIMNDVEIPYGCASNNQRVQMVLIAKFKKYSRFEMNSQRYYENCYRLPSRICAMTQNIFKKNNLLFLNNDDEKRIYLFTFVKFHYKINTNVKLVIFFILGIKHRFLKLRFIIF